MSAPTPAAPVLGLPHTWRPLLARVVTLVLAALVLICSVGIYALLPSDIRVRFSGPQLVTLVVFLALAAGVLYVVARGRVTADRDGLTVVNMLNTRRLEWAQVVRVRMRPGDPWVHLELADGTVLAATGIQASDGERGRRAAAELRALVSAMTRTERDD